MSDPITANFSLIKPQLGSYFGSWNGPVNLNMDLIDAALQCIKTSNKTLAQSAITTEGTLWYDTVHKTLFINNGTSSLVSLVTSGQFLLTLEEQQELSGGYLSVTDLHSHPGHSTQFYSVKDPTLASTTTELANKQYFAVPFALFNNSVSAINGFIDVANGILGATVRKLNGLSANGIDISIGNATATGSVSAVSLIAKAGTSGGTITIGGGTSTTLNEIKTSNTNPINFIGASDLQVGGNIVWSAGNQGSGTGMNADKVDSCHVDDTKTDTSSLWTSAKISSVLSGGVSSIEEVAKANTLGNHGGTFYDAAHFATAQGLEDHKTSGDHDSRYVQPKDLFNIMVGGTILFDTAMVTDWATHFDGTWTGLAGSTFDGWKVCTGHNGTQNLIDKFVIGGGPGATMPTTGGWAGGNATIAPNQLPKHYHCYYGDDQIALGSRGYATPITPVEIAAAPLFADGTINNIAYDAKSDGSGAPPPYKTQEFTERGKPISILPPYIAMMYMTRYK